MRESGWRRLGSYFLPGFTYQYCCLSLQFKNHLKTAVDILYANPSAETFSMQPLATIQPNELYSIPIDKAQSFDYYIRRNDLG